MLKRLAVAGTLAVVSTLTLIPSASAAPDYAVQVKHRPARIHGDGSVTVVFWLRCRTGYNAFEYNASVSQGDTFESVTGGSPPDVLVCDGTRHRHAVDVLPEAGTFRRGFADIDVNVQISPGGGADLEAEDSARVWLKRH